MREWMQRRNVVVSLHARVSATRQTLAGVQRRYADAVASLRALLPADTTATTADLPAVLAAADRLCHAREVLEDRLAKARQSAETANAELQKSERGVARIETEMAHGRAEWAALAVVLGLPADTSADQATPALNVWNEIDVAVRARQEALNRIAEMTVTIERFAADTQAVVSRVAPDLTGVDPPDAVAALAARLAAARLAKGKRNETTEQLTKVLDQVRHLGQERDATDGVLAGLRAVAEVADDEALRQAIGRMGEHHALSRQIHDRQTELRDLDDGKSPEDLAAEAAGTDVDALPGRIAALHRRGGPGEPGADHRASTRPRDYGGRPRRRRRGAGHAHHAC